MQKIGLSELLLLGFEIRSSTYLYPKTCQRRKLYKISRQNDVLEAGYLVLAALPKGYELYYDDEHDKPFIRKKMKKDPFPKLVEKWYPDKLVEVIDNA